MLQANPVARMVNDYLMKMALPLGLWFIALNLLRYAATSSVVISMIATPLILVTPVALWKCIKGLRQELGGFILGIQAWIYGVQLMFFAGLIEGLFIYIYNQFIRPGNLARVFQASIQQYENVLTTLKSLGGYESWIPKFEETLEKMKVEPVLTPIESAISTLSNDMFFGMILMIPIALIVRRMPRVS